ncbi:MAG: Hydrogenase assembly chaperone HypC/HupF [Candidatus Moranbacteria bacterium GW2011_GWE2_35_2-]|nr:MAG: Hydrogenase assembly chaperone HypC/HupF [Candidatus Moranbacteria bacterium GW2011_GWE2_35_2-]KKQ06422.1 MAG: Hydrogenase assembly chaperone HypC/HupF [Candidatus Moranbacteria bacterium GW2011_GWF1_36_4]KKQ22901.1 MAG: Hydrogenase assembly chaperone HypC/HupF [Candidatus Moranbacteria bacterium GW2011_GWF2_37_11]KKQ29259.1 MAG: Hydrogenase assembly chaperone HypC/HupF [Candidatus Moranbacteria bacterium GW2011_GWD1_37_17]KKQ30868.1 MAG: Hydrogenase assembly chaperone HypC/HupF [Candid
MHFEFSELIMCLAYPGKIKSIKNGLATVDFDGIEKEVNVSLVDAKKGDYVIVHAGFAIEVMDKKTGEDSQEIFK